MLCVTIMTRYSNINKFPEGLINECSFCHDKGLKPGVLAIEFKDDLRTKKYFSQIVNELELNDNGICCECTLLTSSA